MREIGMKGGAEEGLTVIDLNGLSTALLDQMTPAQADKSDASGLADARAENGTPALDRTHLNSYGQQVFGRMVADQFVRTQVELGPDLIGEPAGKSIVPAFAKQPWRCAAAVISLRQLSRLCVMPRWEPTKQ